MSKQIKANINKQLNIDIDGKTYLRFPIQTHLITEKDSILKVVKRYALPYIREGDTLIVAERIVAISEGRSFPIEQIRPGFFAKWLSRFVYNHPGGIGLRDPSAMQLAIEEAGLFRIFFGTFVSAVTKIFGVRGIFYRVVGHDINAIDGPSWYTLPPGDRSVKLGPKNPMRTAKSLSNELGIPVAVIDANDYGVRVMGYSDRVNPLLIEKTFKDNPLGQGHEQTPLALLRVL